MADRTGLDAFAQQYPHLLMWVLPNSMLLLCRRPGTKNFHPVVAIYSTFLQRAYDQIVRDVCMQNLPVLFALDRAGIVGEDSETHHGVFDLAYLRHSQFDGAGTA